MGEEIHSQHFADEDFERFRKKLHKETRLLEEWIASNKLATRSLISGYEVEAWLLNEQLQPASANDRFLHLLNLPDLVSPELAQFNFEINTLPHKLKANCFSDAHKEIQGTWSRVQEMANNLNMHTAMIGILPTATETDFTLNNISESNRYAALNEQILAQRQGRPLKITIPGNKHLAFEHQDVMLESASTSFQIHIQVPIKQAARYQNAATIVSAIMVAIGANSPFLFGKDLWAETRIPLFEQSVESGGFDSVAHGPIRRVNFGLDYVKKSIIEYFAENLEHYPILLPIIYNTPLANLRHLRLHNGTIWRWNRPLIGFDEKQRPHFRIEHRVLPAGPTIIDMVANAVFFYGLVHALAQLEEPPENHLPFTTAKDNFYKAARYGLDTQLTWMDSKAQPIDHLILNELINLAKQGLKNLDIDNADIKKYIGIIKARVLNKQNGSQWQREFAKRTGYDMHVLTEAYIENQNTNEPVHTWELPHLPKKSNNIKLTVLSDIPDGFLDVDAKSLHTLFKGPTLIEIPGEKTQGLFISILLHGNEDTGLYAIQKLLSEYKNKKLPRPIYLFVGNVEAARYSLRFLEEQSDYNRVWPGTNLENRIEIKIMQEIYDRMQAANILLSIDIHNNTGINPHYACINKLDYQFMYLATMFSRTVVYFIRPTGVQSLAFSELCPSITLECGQAGHEYGINHACEFIQSCLNLDSIPEDVIPPEDIDLFHTVAQVKIADNCHFSFNDRHADICFHPDIEYMNFKETTKGTPLGYCSNVENEPLIVLNDDGENIYKKYFYIEDNAIHFKRTVMPSMFTTDERVIEQDCLCYLMERIKPNI